MVTLLTICIQGTVYNPFLILTDFNIFYETVLININNGDKVMAYNKQKYKEVDKKISDSFAKLVGV